MEKIHFFFCFSFHRVTWFQSNSVNGSKVIPILISKKTFCFSSFDFPIVFSRNYSKCRIHEMRKSWYMMEYVNIFTSHLHIHRIPHDYYYYFFYVASKSQTKWKIIIIQKGQWTKCYSKEMHEKYTCNLYSIHSIHIWHGNHMICEADISNQLIFNYKTVNCIQYKPTCVVFEILNERINKNKWKIIVRSLNNKQSSSHKQLATQYTHSKEKKKKNNNIKMIL